MRKAPKMWCKYHAYSVSSIAFCAIIEHIFHELPVSINGKRFSGSHHSNFPGRNGTSTHIILKLRRNCISKHREEVEIRDALLNILDEL